MGRLVPPAGAATYDDLISAACDKEDLSVKAWAKEHGLHYQTVRDAMAGKRNPQPKTRARFAKALGLKPSELPGAHREASE